MEFFRCQYTDDSGMQCEKWFDAAKKPDPTLIKFCPDHDGIIGEKLAADPDVKERYIDLVNGHRKIVAEMNIDEIDEHIAGLEKLIEAERTKLLTSRAVRAEKIDKLTDEEREVRRSIKLERAKNPEKKSSRASKVQTISNKPTIKSDPVGYLMANYGFTREQAESQLGVKK